MKSRYYAIRKGRKVGVFYGLWRNIEKYVKKFPGAEFKGFNSQEEAERYLGLTPKRKKDTNKNTLSVSFSTTITLSRNEISIIVRGHQLFHEVNRPSFFEYIMLDEFGEVIRKCQSPYMNGLTVNGSIILAIIDAVSTLKDPCHIVVYDKTPFGLKKMIQMKRSPNAKFLLQLRDALEIGQHTIDEVTDVIHVERLMIKYAEKGMVECLW